MMRTPTCALLLLLLLPFDSSLPVSQSHLEHEDMKVMKCIVEVLADALSSPQLLPVSQRCLETLRNDDRLISMLRHQNFLQELQDITGEGTSQRSEIGDVEHSDLQDTADQSMLMAIRTPGETLKEEKKRESQENDIITSHEEMEEKGKKTREQAVMKKTGNSEEVEDETETAGAPEHKPLEEGQGEEFQEEEESVEKSSPGVGKKKHWSGGKESVRASRRAYADQEASHHSKEAWNSPEGEALQMVAGREPDGHRDPEEGSAIKKTEDAEMESLAVMENQLENMAQKLHELRHG